MDNLLSEILQTSKSTQKALNNLSDDISELDTSNGMSLLALKNESLLSYVHNSILILLSQIDTKTSFENKKKSDEIRSSSIKNAITDRIVLEKGIKGLESRVSYEIDRALRNYEKAKATTENSNTSNTVNDDTHPNEEEEEKEDLLSFRPNPFSLLSSGNKNDKKNNNSSQGKKKPNQKKHNNDGYNIANDKEEEDYGDDDDDDNDNEDNQLYKAPKISAIVPVGGEARKSAKRIRRNEMLEEFLQESSYAPQLEHSIGSTIVDAGRGIKSDRDTRKEREIRDYEESNYTRLPEKTKEKHKGKKRRHQDSFFGESWNFSNTTSYDSTKKKKNSSSVWEKTSKRRSR